MNYLLGYLPCFKNTDWVRTIFAEVGANDIANDADNYMREQAALIIREVDPDLYEQIEKYHLAMPEEHRPTMGVFVLMMLWAGTYRAEANQGQDFRVTYDPYNKT